MKLVVMGKDPKLGLSLKELRDFAQQTADWPDDEYLDCYVPREDQEKPQVAALMGLEASAQINCPRCGTSLQGEPVMHAISRVDNHTRICTGCGNDEAMWDMLRHDEDLPPVDRPCR